MWYKNYPKGAPFYTVTINLKLQKNYFAGWCLITRNDNSTVDNLLTIDGGMRSYDNGPHSRGIHPFPECDLEANIQLLKKYKARSLEGRIKVAELALSKLREESSAMDSWSPDVIDFADRKDFDWNTLEPDNGVYTEVHLA